MDTPIRPFKNSGGLFYLRGLFYEESQDKSTVVYTLKDRPHEGFPSLYQLFMDTNDPTEWKFATTCLDGWEHWERLCECTWFKPYVARWRRELQLRVASQSLARIMAEAKSSSRDAFQANKYLLEKGWEPKETKKAGRPTKDAIRQEAASLAASNSQIDTDYERLIQRAH